MKELEGQHESRLKWYGHVLRREDGYVGKRVMAVEVPGKRRRERPTRRCLDNIKNLSETELSGEEAQDRVKLEGSRKKYRPIDTVHRPQIKLGKDAEEEEYFCGMLVRRRPQSSC